MGRRKDGRSKSKETFQQHQQFLITLVSFVFQFVGNDIFCVSRATFFLFVVVIVCYLRTSPHNNSKMVSTLAWREREREVCYLAQSEKEEETGTLTG
jgi:hypothetical protein